jgi:primosomal protein N' (replication factor Y)
MTAEKPVEVFASPATVVPVAVDLPQHAGLTATLDYLLPSPAEPGTVLRVPLGRRTVTGVLWDEPTPDSPDGAVTSSSDAAVPLKAVAEVIHALPPLPLAWRKLVSFAASYYQRSVGEVALASLPAELRRLDGAGVARRIKRWATKAAQPQAGAHQPMPSPCASASAAPGAPAPTEARPALTPEQQQAIQALAQADDRPVLLFGATGSGKTEVYLQAARRALDAGRQVMLLVPEINLTPQLERRLSERFPDQTLVALHSALTPAERLRHWWMALSGQADLVLGTRLAVFTPLARPGLIVVDEEHDPSFKQQDGARYSARDLAVYRGQLERVPVILGSATPSLETWQRAEQGRYRRLDMPARIGGGAMPVVRLLDMSRQPKPAAGAAAPPALAAPLLEAIEQRRARGEQSLLLLNRRGYAPVLHCGACSWKSQCPHCSAWRVFHKADRTLRCHHCGLSERVPRACPECGNLDIAPIGRGTEKLEEQLGALLPDARIARIDADTTRLKGELDARLAAVHAGEVDVLVGTQMVTKGHDFRRMTLVAAVNPDGALFAADFRAAERLFALLLQAAGRAGRDAQHAAASEMWLQTWHPQHPVYAALRRHDFRAFAQQQLAERQQAGLPPFAHLALLRADARTAQAAREWLQDAVQAAASLPESAGIRLYPPVPPAVARVADVERLHVMIESESRPALQRLLAAWNPDLVLLGRRRPGVLRWAIDVDPLAI